jgi:hypothetical protein
MFTLDNNVGRLCEIYTDSSLTVADMTPFRARLATVFQSITGRVVIISDLRQCGALPDAVIGALIAIGRIDNPKIERHALLVTAGQPIAEQMELVVAAAGSPNRRTFTVSIDAHAWLREVLTRAESTRMGQFIGER